jgi:hypothetical protein
VNKTIYITKEDAAVFAEKTNRDLYDYLPGWIRGLPAPFRSWREMKKSPKAFTEYFSDEEIMEAKAKFPRKDRIHALLHRLDCAERTVQVLGSDPLSGEVSKAYESWLKAAGKDSHD